MESLLPQEIWAATGIEGYPEFDNKTKEDFALRLILEGGHYCKIHFLTPKSAVIKWVRLIQKVRLLLATVRYFVKRLRSFYGVNIGSAD